jgi:membrane protease YdiL (CAAX protease family)
MRRLHSRARNRQAAVSSTVADAVVVNLCCSAGALAAYMLARIVVDDIRFAWLSWSYTAGLLGLGVPILWIRRRYGLPKEALGLQCGKLRPMTSVALGMGLAVAYYPLIRVHLFPPQIGAGTQPSALALLLSPLSLSGFASTVLTPLGEEVLFRGLLYAFLRQALGTGPALVVQAVLFGALHLGTAPHSTLTLGVDAGLIGLMLGLLYEKTKSLYPSMFCHGTINYLAMLYPLFS